jgi:site-specific DNA recombinase
MHIKHRGVEMRLVLNGKDNTAPKPDPALIKAIARAHRWFDDLVTGRAQSLAAIAKTESVSDRYVAHLLPLAFFAPDIVEAVLAGTQPPELTAETLIKRTEVVPHCWTVWQRS